MWRSRRLRRARLPQACWTCDADPSSASASAYAWEFSSGSIKKEVSKTASYDAVSNEDLLDASEGFRDASEEFQDVSMDFLDASTDFLDASMDSLDASTDYLDASTEFPDASTHCLDLAGRAFADGQSPADGDKA